MKQLLISAILILTAQLSLAEPHGLVKEISEEAIKAVQDYFETSNRKIEKTEVQSFSRLNSLNLDYLVDLEVKGESPHDQTIIRYHCGVFLKRDRTKWQNQYTACETLDQLPILDED